MLSYSDLHQELANRAEEIARHLLPGGKRQSHEYIIGDTNGNAGRSLAVHLTGEKAGIWSDFSTGEKGNLITLWQITKSVTRREALKDIKSYLGVTDKFYGQKKMAYSKPRMPKNCVATQEARVAPYLSSKRFLSPNTIESYNVKAVTCETRSLLLFPFERDGEIINYQYKVIDPPKEGEKKPHPWFAKGQDNGKCELCLFGWQTVDDNATELLIAEAPIDAMSWYEYGIRNCVAVPNGATSHNWVENDYERLSQFETIYISFDMDEAGRKGREILAERLGRERCRFIELPAHDPNECLQKGVPKEDMLRCYQAASSADPQQLKTSSDYLEDVLEDFYPSGKHSLGIPLPWSNEVMLRPGELSVWTGYNSHGKTTMLSEVMLWAISLGERVCVVSLESHPKRVLTKLVRQATVSRLPTQAHIQICSDALSKKIWLYNWGNTATPDSILHVWEYARARYGVTQFVLDNLTAVTGIKADDYEQQRLFMAKMQEYVRKKNIHVHVVNHTRKPSDDRNIASRMDVRGSGAITDLADNVFIVWKNGDRAHGKTSSSPFDAALKCDKQREGDWVGTIDLFYHVDSKRYVLEPNTLPVLYIPINKEVEYEF